MLEPYSPTSNPNELLGTMELLGTHNSLTYTVQILPDFTPNQRDCRTKLLAYRKTLLGRNKQVIIKSHHWNGMMVDGAYKSIDALQREYNLE